MYIIYSKDKISFSEFISIFIINYYLNLQYLTVKTKLDPFITPSPDCL